MCLGLAWGLRALGHCPLSCGPDQALAEEGSLPARAGWGACGRPVVGRRSCLFHLPGLILFASSRMSLAITTSRGVSGWLRRVAVASAVFLGPVCHIATGRGSWVLTLLLCGVLGLDPWSLSVGLSDGLSGWWVAGLVGGGAS